MVIFQFVMLIYQMVFNLSFGKLLKESGIELQKQETLLSKTVFFFTII